MQVECTPEGGSIIDQDGLDALWESIQPILNWVFHQIGQSAGWLLHMQASHHGPEGGYKNPEPWGFSFFN